MTNNENYKSFEAYFNYKLREYRKIDARHLTSSSESEGSKVKVRQIKDEVINHGRDSFAKYDPSEPSSPLKTAPQSAFAELKSYYNFFKKKDGLKDDFHIASKAAQAVFNNKLHSFCILKKHIHDHDHDHDHDITGYWHKSVISNYYEIVVIRDILESVNPSLGSLPVIRDIESFLSKENENLDGWKKTAVKKSRKWDSINEHAQNNFDITKSKLPEIIGAVLAVGIVIMIVVGLTKTIGRVSNGSPNIEIGNSRTQSASQSRSSAYDLCMAEVMAQEERVIAMCSTQDCIEREIARLVDRCEP